MSIMGSVNEAIKIVLFITISYLLIFDIFKMCLNDVNKLYFS